MLFTIGNEGAVPIINYHFFSADTSSGFVCSKKDLISQLTYLKQNYMLLSLPKAFDFLENGNMTGEGVCITIDDGDETFFKFAWPIFKDFDIPIHVNLVTGYLGKIIGCDFPTRIMNMKEVNALINSDKVTFASHSMSHKKLNELSTPELVYEIVESKKIIEDMAGECNIFCYPYGGVTVVTYETEKVLYDNSYRYALTTAGDRLIKGTDRYRVSRINIINSVSVNKLIFYLNSIYYHLRRLHNYVTGNKFYNQLSIAGHIGID
jgi:hypothetical protein